jgi:uncharacterized lipoprotein YehR (DUF1307 family)
MKKIIFCLLTISLLFLITGCFKEENDTSYQTKICTDDSLDQSIVTIKYDENNIVKKITEVIKFSSSHEQMAETFSLSFKKVFDGVDGVSSSYSNLNWTYEFDFTKLSIEDYKKYMIIYMKDSNNVDEQDINFKYIINDTITVDSLLNYKLSYYVCS